MKVRIKFYKHGAMKFIGHLDMMRYFQKAIRRADIDVTYTTGFSPHQVMSFAAPLGVGLESDGEYLDIETRGNMNGQAILDALNETMAEGIGICSVKALPENAKGAMASVAAAGYRVSFRKGYEPDFDIQAAIKAFMEKPALLVTKKTKRGEKELDLKPGIYEFFAEDDSIYMLVDASSSGNIKPKLVLEALFSFQGKELMPFALEITRTETYMTAEDGELMPLEAAGTAF